MNNIKHLFRWAATMFRQWKTVRHMRRICRLADELHQLRNETHFVVRINNQITPIGRSQFKYLRQHGMFPKHFTITQLRQQAFYVSKKNAKR